MALVSALLWAVPVVAASLAFALVLARARQLEDLSVEILVAVHRTRELRPPLVELRRELDRSGPLVERIWDHWSSAGHPDDEERS